MFATFYEDFFQLTDLDENYSDDFVKDAFKIDGNGLLQPCKCNQKMSESEDQNNDDDDDKTLGKQLIKHESGFSLKVVLLSRNAFLKSDFFRSLVMPN